jgi:hypothetical protein
MKLNEGLIVSCSIFTFALLYSWHVTAQSSDSTSYSLSVNAVAEHEWISFTNENPTQSPRQKTGSSMDTQTTLERANFIALNPAPPDPADPGDPKMVPPNPEEPDDVPDDNSGRLEIFPNPVTDILNISNPVEAVIFIYDLTGQQKLCRKSGNVNEGIDLSFLPQGRYILHAHSAGKVQRTYLQKN